MLIALHLARGICQQSPGIDVTCHFWVSNKKGRRAHMCPLTSLPLYLAASTVQATDGQAELRIYGWGHAACVEHSGCSPGTRMLPWWPGTWGLLSPGLSPGLSRIMVMDSKTCIHPASSLFFFFSFDLFFLLFSVYFSYEHYYLMFIQWHYIYLSLLWVSWWYYIFLILFSKWFPDHRFIIAEIFVLNKSCDVVIVRLP